jgi:putative oxidoreductase
MWNKLIPPELDARVSSALLPLRVAAGIWLATHGWGKIQNPFHWMGDGDGAAPAFFQLLAAISEFGGGIALACGLLTPLACFGIACTMAVAVHRHVTKGGSFELAGIYLAIAVLFLVAGPGRWSLDAIVTRRWRVR